MNWKAVFKRCPECKTIRQDGLPGHQPGCSRMDLESATALLDNYRRMVGHYQHIVSVLVQDKQRWEGKFRIVTHENNKLRKRNERLGAELARYTKGDYQLP